MDDIKVSGSFRRSIYKVLFAITFFFLSYLFLVALSIALLIACVAAAVLLVTAKINFLTLAGGAGLVALGVMFFVFLVKFIFSKHRNINPYRKQIDKEDYPELFAVIEEVADAVGTDYPKKVYLRHDVNASVFYNSSFWSLFFPVKKNLDLGLGLVNSVNLGEFKAILAHEFGHFSQKSMQVGSYVYTVNNVIYNLVYEHDRWDDTLESWSNHGGIFGIFALITYKMVELVRSILRWSYNIVNIPYMGLSREMEFHADLIAAKAAGKQNMISALRRIEFCNLAFNQSLQSLGEFVNNKKIVTNLYEIHTSEINSIGKYFNLEFSKSLPIITKEDLVLHTVKPRVNYKDQWASHPSREDRENHINTYKGNELNEENQLAWSLFANAANCQEEITQILYSVDYGDLNEYTRIGKEEYEQNKEIQKEKFEINDFYNGFYSNRFLYPIDTERVLDQQIELLSEKVIQEVYSTFAKQKFKKLEFDHNDLITLHAIKNKEIKTKYFEFDNNKYHRRQVYVVIKQIEDEINKTKEDLQLLEERALILNINIAAKISEECQMKLMRDWNLILDLQNLAEEHEKFINSIGEFQTLIYNKSKWHEEEVERLIRDLLKLEKEYKLFIPGLKIEQYEEITGNHYTILSNYLKDEFSYMRVTTFEPEAFASFADFIFENQGLINSKLLLKIKELTDWQYENLRQLELTSELDRVIC